MTLRFRIRLASLAAALGVASAGWAGQLPDGWYYQEAGGMVVGEGEIFSARTTGTGSNTNSWKIAPDEVTGGDNTLSITNARGGQYVQVLPDTGAPGSPTNPPSIQYQMSLVTTGIYQLYVRWEGNGITGTNSFGSSDSLFADIVELKDGTGGLIADWYELNQSLDGNFATNPWDAGGGFEQNVASPANSAMTWAVTSPGIYTLRFSQREDGAAVDAWVFQLSSLPAPTGDGPAMSVLIPEPSSGLLVLGGLGALLFWRRRSH